MKKLMILIAMLVLASSAFASTWAPGIKTYYQPKFEVVAVEPLCPSTIPGGAVCMAIGSRIKVKATLNGCLDKLRFFESQNRTLRGATELHIMAIAHDDPKNATVRCVKAPEVFKDIILPNHIYGEINLINMELENY
jgi:hypothetical protein